MLTDSAGLYNAARDGVCVSDLPGGVNIIQLKAALTREG